MRRLFAALSVIPFVQASRTEAGPEMWQLPAATFVPVRDEEMLDGLFSASNEGPVVLFLHDPYCPISARAHRRVTDAGGEVYFIDVSRQHGLNRAVEARTGVRHESPQAFVLRDGKPVWNASHGRISTESIGYARDGELGD